MTPFSTHYDNLQVARRSTDSVIRAAYRVLCQKYHPDKFDGDPAEAERIMKLITQAYTVLSDPAQRASHDAWINEQEDAAFRTGESAHRDADGRGQRAEQSRREDKGERPSAEEAGRRYRASVERRKQETGFVEKPLPKAERSKRSVDWLSRIRGLIGKTASVLVLLSVVLIASMAVTDLWLKRKNTVAVAEPQTPIVTAGWNLSTLPGVIDGRWKLIWTNPPPHGSKSFIDSKSIGGNTHETGVWIRQYFATTSPVKLLDENSTRYSTIEFHLFVQCKYRSAAAEDFHYYGLDGAEMFGENTWAKYPKEFSAIKPGDGVKEAVFDLVCR